MPFGKGDAGDQFRLRVVLWYMLVDGEDELYIPEPIDLDAVLGNMVGPDDTNDFLRDDERLAQSLRVVTGPSSPFIEVSSPDATAFVAKAVIDVHGADGVNFSVGLEDAGTPTAGKGNTLLGWE